MFFIRSATYKDLPALQYLLEEAWHHAYDEILGEEKVSEFVATYYTHPNLAAKTEELGTSFLVGVQGEELAGMIFAMEVEDHVRIYELYVYPKFQDTQIGSMLLKEIEKIFYNLDGVVVEVLEKNTKGIAFYKKHGFEKFHSGHQHEDLEPGILTLFMEKPINQIKD